MSRLHICNTFFEKELETSSQKPLTDWMRFHPIHLQLQFLPLLYALPEDRILVSDFPPNPDPRLCLIDQPPHLPIEHWGPSLSIASWAQKHRIPYSIPDWELIRTINSKVFSFTHSPRLPGAELLQTPQEIQTWLEKTPGPKVLKTPFGTAANGHTIVNAKGKRQNAKLNVKRQYTTPRNEAFVGDPRVSNVKRLYICPLIGEPWVERVADFSTQWENGRLLGVTPFENGVNGTYRGTYVGEVELWALEEHLAVARPLIEKIGKMGYQGHVGIDAFIYLWEGKKRVHPIVEINARKTMSWVALQRPEKQLFYAHSKEGLLPDQLKTIHFARNIKIRRS